MSSVLTVEIDGVPFDNIVRCMVRRDMQFIAGTFELTIVDQGRIRNALLAQIGRPEQNAPVKKGSAIVIAIDGETVLSGYVEWTHLIWESDRIECRLRGRDKTGDLIDCAALPYGPTEFRGVNLLAVAKTVCTPFGITVRADVDVGAPFERLALHKHMTGLSFLESASRQRSILLVSDGVGGLLLTRGGRTRAPAAVKVGENVQRVEVESDWSTRFSDYFVMQDTVGRRSGGAAMTSETVPASSSASGDVPGPATEVAAETIGTVGHVTDPEIVRWRPTVRLTRSQSGMTTVQEQAAFQARVAKALSEAPRMTIPGFRAGPDNLLWKTNQITTLSDPYSGNDRDMLISGVSFEWDDRGAFTHLYLTGPSAFDRINEADRHRRGVAPSAAGAPPPPPLTIP